MGLRILVCAGVLLSSAAAYAAVGTSNSPSAPSPTVPTTTVQNTAKPPDLIVTKVLIGKIKGLSRELQVDVKNIGGSAAGGFWRVDVYRTTPPYLSVLFEGCPTTVFGQQNTAPGCNLGTSNVPASPLGAGQTKRFKGWVTFTAPESGKQIPVEVVADGCDSNLEPNMPPYCRVNESDETNNRKSAVIPVP